MKTGSTKQKTPLFSQSRTTPTEIKKEKEKPKRKLGLLEGKVKVYFADDFKMTEEEFLGL